MNTHAANAGNGVRLVPEICPVAAIVCARLSNSQVLFSTYRNQASVPSLLLVAGLGK